MTITITPLDQQTTCPSEYGPAHAFILVSDTYGSDGVYGCQRCPEVRLGADCDSHRSPIAALLVRVAALLRANPEMEAGKALVSAAQELIPSVVPPGTPIRAVRAVCQYADIDTRPGPLTNFVWWSNMTPLSDVLAALEGTADSVG